MKHEDNVECIKLNHNEKILFSASLDQKVILWSMESYSELCILNADSPLRSLYLTSDNDYIMAKTKPNNNNPRKLLCWKLE